MVWLGLLVVFTESVGVLARVDSPVPRTEPEPLGRALGAAVPAAGICAVLLLVADPLPMGAATSAGFVIMACAALIWMVLRTD